MCRHRIARVVLSLVVVAAAARANHGPDPQTEPGERYARLASISTVTSGTNILGVSST